MKLWDSLTTCLILLSSVRGSPVKTNPRSSPSSSPPRERPEPIQINLSITSPRIPVITHHGGKASVYEETYTMDEVLPEQFEDVVDFIKVTISRVRRSSSSSQTSSTSPLSKETVGSDRTRHRRERKKGQKGASQRTTGGKGKASGGDAGRRSGGRRRASSSGAGAGRGDRGRGQGCVLRQIHLNVSDLGLGYRSGEEMIFRYCSGPCRKSETNYDKILNNLVNNRKFPPKDTPLHACCRPTAFDDDLSFLDDNMIYHTVRRLSARKCGCV